MASYTLNLGFTWDSPQIGETWDTGTALSQRFLQLALADSSGAAAWFQFDTSDSLSFELFDLGTGLQNKVSSYAVSLSLADPGSTTIYNPSSYLTYSSSTNNTTYLALDTASFSYTSTQTPCWGTARGCSTPSATVTFSTAAQLQMSLLVAITNDNDVTQQFLKTVLISVS